MFVIVWVFVCLCVCAGAAAGAGECGLPAVPPHHVDDTQRIVGGWEAVPGSWPWQAYLIWQGIFVCSATLIRFGHSIR